MNAVLGTLLVNRRPQFTPHCLIQFGTRREVPIRTFDDWNSLPRSFCGVDMVVHGDDGQRQERRSLGNFSAPLRRTGASVSLRKRRSPACVLTAPPQTHFRDRHFNTAEDGLGRPLLDSFANPR
jgi:hypothetical protein